jgi:hypothetical protein
MTKQTRARTLLHLLTAVLALTAASCEIPMVPEKGALLSEPYRLNTGLTSRSISFERSFEGHPYRELRGSALNGLLPEAVLRGWPSSAGTVGPRVGSGVMDQP